MVSESAVLGRVWGKESSVGTEDLSVGKPGKPEIASTAPHRLVEHLFEEPGVFGGVFGGDEVFCGNDVGGPSAL